MDDLPLTYTNRIESHIHRIIIDRKADHILHMKTVQGDQGVTRRYGLNFRDLQIEAEGAIVQRKQPMNWQFIHLSLKVCLLLGYMEGK